MLLIIHVSSFMFDCLRNQWGERGCLVLGRHIYVGVYVARTGRGGIIDIEVSGLLWLLLHCLCMDWLLLYWLVVY